MCVCVCIYIYIWIDVSLSVSVSVSLALCVLAGTIDACMHIVYMHVCTHIHAYKQTRTHTHTLMHSHLCRAAIAHHLADTSVFDCFLGLASQQQGQIHT